MPIFFRPLLEAALCVMCSLPGILRRVLARDGTLLGKPLKPLVTLGVREAAGARVRHLRTTVMRAVRPEGQRFKPEERVFNVLPDSASFSAGYRVTASRRSYTLTLPPTPFGPLKTCPRRT